MSARVTNCCGCIPLRIGLLIWGYFALIAIYLSALSSLYSLQDYFYAQGPSKSDEFFYSFISLVIILLYFIFHVTLVAGLHKKSCCMLEVHNGFLKISMMLEGIAAALYIPLALRRYFYYGDIDESTVISWTVLFFAIVIIVVELLWKYYILVCVRSLISKLNGSKVDNLSKKDVDPDVIILDNTNKKRKEAKIQQVGNSDVTVHDNTRTGIKEDNIESIENPIISIHDNTNNSTKDENSDVTVHDNTGIGNKNDNIESVETPIVSVHDNTNNRTKDENIQQQLGNSDVTVHDNTGTGSKEDNIEFVENPIISIHDNINNRRKDENIQQVGNSDVTVHDNTGTGNKEDNIESVETPIVSVHDNTIIRTNDDNIPQVGSSDVIIHDDTKTGSR